MTVCIYKRKQLGHPKAGKKDALSAEKTGT